MKNDIRSIITKNMVLKKEYIKGNNKENFFKIHIASKIVSDDGNADRKILLIIEEA